MPDREKVESELQSALEWCQLDDDPNGSIAVKIWAVRDAISLLKEQEPVKPEVYYVGPDKYKFYCCPVCKIAWYYKGNYCLGCGRAVTWDE